MRSRLLRRDSHMETAMLGPDCLARTQVRTNPYGVTSERSPLLAELIVEPGRDNRSAACQVDHQGRLAAHVASRHWWSGDIVHPSPRISGTRTGWTSRSRTDSQRLLHFSQTGAVISTRRSRRGPCSVAASSGASFVSSREIHF